MSFWLASSLPASNFPLLINRYGKKQMRVHNGHSVDCVFIHPRAPAAKFSKAENDALGLGNKRDVGRHWDKKRKTKEAKRERGTKGKTRERGRQCRRQRPTRQFKCRNLCQRERLRSECCLLRNSQQVKARPLRPSLETWVQFPGPTLWKERPDSYPQVFLCPQKHVMACGCMHTQLSFSHSLTHCFSLSLTHTIHIHTHTHACACTHHTHTPNIKKCEMIGKIHTHLFALTSSLSNVADHRRRL